MVVKLRPGWAYNAKGKAVPKDALNVSEALAPLLKGCTPPKPGKAPKRPAYPFVLKGSVKMTPRRYALLTVVLTEALSWVEKADFRGGGYAHGLRWCSIWDGHDVSSTLTTLRRLRLIRWQEPLIVGIPTVTLTARGLQALLEYEQLRESTQ